MMLSQPPLPSIVSSDLAFSNQFTKHAWHMNWRKLGFEWNAKKRSHLYMKRLSWIVASGRIVVDGKLIVELKCKECLHPVDEAQLLSHLRLLNLPIGLLINFHVVLLKNGIKRMVNNYREE